MMPGNPIAMDGPAQPGDWRKLAARRKRLEAEAFQQTEHMRAANLEGVEDPRFYSWCKSRRAMLNAAAERADFRAMEILREERRRL